MLRPCLCGGSSCADVPGLRGEGWKEGEREGGEVEINSSAAYGHVYLIAPNPEQGKIRACREGEKAGNTRLSIPRNIFPFHVGDQQLVVVYGHVSLFAYTPDLFVGHHFQLPSSYSVKGDSRKSVTKSTLIHPTLPPTLPTTSDPQPPETQDQDHSAFLLHWRRGRVLAA